MDYECLVLCLFFFKQKTAYEMRISDWSSDVCSSDLFASLSTYASAECVKLMKDAGVKFSALPPEDLAAARKISDEALQRMAGDDEDTKRVLKIIADTSQMFASRPANI